MIKQEEVMQYRIYSDIVRNAYVLERRVAGKWSHVAEMSSLRDTWVIVWNTIKR